MTQHAQNNEQERKFKKLFLEYYFKQNRQMQLPIWSLYFYCAHQLIDEMIRFRSSKMFSKVVHNPRTQFTFYFLLRMANLKSVVGGVCGLTITK